jgi:recombination protein RecA
MSEPRKRLNVEPDDDGGDYFAPEPEDTTLPVAFIPTGCTTLDGVLGGGWPLGRISNVVGDKAVGKTLLAIEACANFAATYPKGTIWYREAEAAFDVPYARGLGLPEDRIDFGPDGIDTSWETLDDILVDLDKQLKTAHTGLYIIDTLDALSSKAELKRVPGDGTYGLEKQKMLGEFFRRLRNRIKRADVHVMFVSQVRDNIGVTFGERYTRVGGKALDFYASQILWLSQLKKVVKTIRGVERPVGVRVRARCKKNKIGMPFRECEFVVRFGYGVDDLLACLEWLKSAGRLDALHLTDKTMPDYLVQSEKLQGQAYISRLREVQIATSKMWDTVEKDFAPKRSKYAAID